MNRLWVRLTLAFALVAVIGIGVAALLTDQSVNSEFRSFIARNEADLQNTSLVSALVKYYQERQSWQGVGAVITSTMPPPRPERVPPDQPADRFNPRPSLLVADATGLIVFDSGQRREADILSASERETATALKANDQTIGYLLYSPGPIGNLLPPEQTFIDQVRRSLLLAALIASAIGGVVGLAFSRTLTRPLDRLALAARAIAAKDLTHRVEPGGTIEVANVAEAFNDMAISLQKAEESAP